MGDKPEAALTQRTIPRSPEVDKEVTTALTNKPATTATKETDATDQRTRQMHLPQLEIVTSADLQAEKIAERQRGFGSLTPEILQLREQALKNAELRAAGKPPNTYDFQPPSDPSDIQTPSPGVPARPARPARPGDRPGPSDTVQPPGPGGDNPTVTPTDRTNRPNKFDGSQYEQAVEEARKQNKPLVMVFGSPGCGYCVQMDRNAWPDQGVQQLLNDKAIFVHVNVAETPGLASQYRIGSYPTTIITRPGEQPLYRHSGALSAGQLRNTLGQYLQ
jgi:thiol-disulfide isomerase/thioredoxin